MARILEKVEFLYNEQVRMPVRDMAAGTELVKEALKAAPKTGKDALSTKHRTFSDDVFQLDSFLPSL